MKHLVIFTMGTRGDVQPYIYLAKELIRSGDQVTIGTHPCWQQLIEEAEVRFAPIGPDIDIELEAAIIRGKNKNPMISMLKTMQFVFKIIKNSSPDILACCKDKDLVIVSHSNMGAVEAQYLQIKTVNVTLQTQAIPQVGKPLSFGEKLFQLFVGPQMNKPYNQIRKLYDMPKIHSMDEIRSRDLNLIPLSRYVIERNPYWDEKNKIVGYWYDTEQNYVPDQKLQDFLNAGERPIILALGAMSFESEQEKEKLDLFVHAFQKTGMRAVIQGFHKTLENYELPDTMMAIGSVPHSWLFRQGYCCIHHCGFGTTASTMVYGIPSIPVPHVLDQYEFADQLVKQKVAVPMIKAGELTEEKVIAAILQMKAHYSELSSTVTQLSKKMQTEHGLETAVSLIEEVIRKQVDDNFYQ